MSPEVVNDVYLEYSFIVPNSAMSEASASFESTAGDQLNRFLPMSSERKIL